MDKMDTRMDRGFAAVADDIGDIREKVATKDQIIALHTQVNAIETEIRSMKHTKLQARVTARSATPQGPIDLQLH